MAPAALSMGRKDYRGYAPQIDPELLHRLWETKEKTGVPITQLVDQPVWKFLTEVHDAV